MNIAVNTRFLLSGRLDGIGWFTHETLKRITRAHPEHTFHFFFDRPFDRNFLYSSNIVPHILFPPARHPLLWHIWFQHTVPRKLKKIKADLFFSPDGFLPLHTDIPLLPVIHDLNFEHYPDDLPFWVSFYYRRMFRRFAAKASRIITVSHFSKKDLTETYSLNPAMVEVAYNGRNNLFHPIPEKEKQEIRQSLTGGRPYLLQTSSLVPRKNIVRLLQAFDHFREQHPGYQLIIAGGKIAGLHQIRQTLRHMTFNSEVIFTGHIDEKTLFKITAAAEASLLLSYFEGFGIPLLEAMACEVPVVCADATALPEIAGGAALLTDPFSVDAITHHLTKIIRDEGLRKHLTALGKERVTHFNWDTTAREVWEVITKTCGS